MHTRHVDDGRCYYNLFGIMRRLGIFEKALRLKDHTHQFINKGASTRAHRCTPAKLIHPPYQKRHHHPH